MPRSGEWRDDAWSVRLTGPPDRLDPLDMDVPGDFSSAAFFLAWAALARVRRPLTIRSVGLNTTRTGLLGVLARMGVDLEVLPAPPRGRADRRPAGRRAGNQPASCRDRAGRVPGLIDEIPIVAALAARAEGVTRITGAAELRVKESDRLSAPGRHLRRMGVEVEESHDGLEIHGTGRHLSGRVECSTITASP